MNRTLQAGFLLASFLTAQARPQSTSDALEQGFKTPPPSARPLVWWHCMNGNITKEGIDLDLGLGGFQNFDAALNTHKVVDQRLVFRFGSISAT